MSAPAPEEGKTTWEDPVQTLKPEMAPCFVFGLSVGWTVSIHTCRLVDCSEPYDNIIQKYPHSILRTMFNPLAHLADQGAREMA